MLAVNCQLPVPELANKMGAIRAWIDLNRPKVKDFAYWQLGNLTIAQVIFLHDRDAYEFAATFQGETVFYM